MKVIISGANGFMGREVNALCEKGYKNSTCVAKIDIAGEGVYPTLKDCPIDGDVLVDFSFHTATKNLLEDAIAKNLPCVIATTGHTAEEKAFIVEASKKIPVFFTANYSLGVAVTAKLVKEAVSFIDGDIEIIETHHNRKVDAPSGTALMLANEIVSVKPDLKIKSGRSGLCKREEKEIGIQSIRMGNVVGIHEVMINTGNETLTIKHEAHARSLFANGALTAAEFLIGKPAGLYDMKSLMK